MHQVVPQEPGAAGNEEAAARELGENVRQVRAQLVQVKPYYRSGFTHAELPASRVPARLSVAESESTALAIM